jgi:hypothetical protein
MGPWVIAGVGLLYAMVAVEQFFKGSTPNAIIFAGYAFSNIGLFMLAK